MEDSATSSQIFHSFLHIAKPVTERTDIIVIKSYSLVVNINVQCMIGDDRNANLCGLCMLHYIVQGFLYS